MIHIPQDSVKSRFTIDGKRLNQEGSNSASLQMMLGNENDVDTSFAVPDAVVRPKSRRSATNLYQCCLTNAVNRHEFTMIVQRLAPEDIHHYVESVGGRVLSREEACGKLLKLLPKSDTTHEKEQLEELLAYFQEHPSTSGVVKVRGTRMSVSTLATRHNSPLAQNDRKIMMVEHADGSFSIHIFIGAVGVNNVRITSRTGEQEIGDPHGSMGFGDHDEGRDSWQKMATTENSISLRSEVDEKLALGERRGRFSKDGSTVVSLFTNFHPSQDMERATSRLRYLNAQGVERQIEVQARMGDLIGEIY